MLDDLRNSAASAFEEEASPSEELIIQKQPRKASKFLGMTAAQRFVIVLMMFLMTCLLGAFCLILTERVVLPFF